MTIPLLFPREWDGEPTLRLEQPIAAAPDLIWRALSSPQGLARWQADEAAGEVSEGGMIRLSWDAFGANVELKVLSCVPHQRLRLRHGASEVEFTLGEHNVSFTQYGLEPGEDVDGLRSSWTVSLAQLAHSVERHPGRRRHVDWAVRLATAAPETLHLYFTEPELLRLWLGETDGPLRVGDSYRCMLHTGTQLTGKVLALVPGRDVALTCDNLGEGVIIFRSIPNPLDTNLRIVAASVSQWGRPTRLASRLAEQLDAALGRLSNMSASIGSA
jgi:uncharacterized protein YndB with AHSA1/START domain